MLNPAAAAAAGNSFLPGLSNASSSKSKSSGSTPSISITPLPRQQQQQAGIKPGQSPNSTTGGKPQFVICEICDGYIKDLDQLRNHMQWIHKVKVSSKSAKLNPARVTYQTHLDSSKNDIQSTSTELPEVSVSILH